MSDGIRHAKKLAPSVNRHQTVTPGRLPADTWFIDQNVPLGGVTIGADRDPVQT